MEFVGHYRMGERRVTCTAYDDNGEYVFSTTLYRKPWNADSEIVEEMKHLIEQMVLLGDLDSEWNMCEPRVEVTD